MVSVNAGASGRNCPFPFLLLMEDFDHLEIDPGSGSPPGSPARLSRIDVASGAGIWAVPEAVLDQPPPVRSPDSM